ncbi:MAG: J domain-containing protein [Acidobacteria bacterium]|nr:MAG: J domain-containing protein [Acidobacteriota bacterium]
MDLYAVLGVLRGADGADIRRAYRRLARRYHPGINPGDPKAQARFVEITRAFETLNDPERRRAYDAGATPEAAPPPLAFGFEGFDFSVKVTSGPDASTFGELFADVLTRASGGGPAHGADLYVTVSLSFEESLTGTERYVQVTRQVTCRSCGGAGAVRSDPVACPACQGTGRIRSARGHMVFAKPCESCEGTGQRSAHPCRACGGAGTETRVESVLAQIPAGVEDGAEISVPGMGHAGRRGGRPGDLHLRVEVAPHSLFRREGDELHLVVPVALHEAALGARVEIPSPDGLLRLRVPPGTQSGQRLRLRGRGVPNARRGGRGDLIVEIRLVLPAILDERSKELLREFARINGEDVRRALWHHSPGQ